MAVAVAVGPGTFTFSLPARFGFLEGRRVELVGLRGFRKDAWVRLRGIWKSSSSSNTGELNKL